MNKRWIAHTALRAVTVTVLAVSGCGTPGPREIVLNQDACHYCRMTISDARFGGEVVTRTGRVMTFDSVECLTSFVRLADSSTIAGVYTMDVQHPGTLIDVKNAGFLRDAIALKSPMGRAVVAFASVSQAEQQRAMLGGTVATWAELLASLHKVPGAEP